MSETKSDNSGKLPGVYKQEDLSLMIELILSGLWRTVNLSKALHLDENTITAWKKRPEVQDAHRRAILKFLHKRQDAEKILGELDMETPAEQPKTLVQINYTPIFGGKSVDALSADNSDPQDIQPEKEA